MIFDFSTVKRRRFWKSASNTVIKQTTQLLFKMNSKESAVVTLFVKLVLFAMQAFRYNNIVKYM